MLYSKYHKDYYKKDVEISPMEEDEVIDAVEEEAPKPKKKRVYRKRAASKKSSKNTES